MLFLYIASFESGYFGGNAVILAEDEYEALRMLNDMHPKKLESDDVKFMVRSPTGKKVVYYDNGDY